MPAGEVFISPELGTSEGKIVFDGCMAVHDRVILIERPIEARVEGGFIKRIEGGAEVESLLETITRSEKNALIFEEEGKLAGGSGSWYARNSRNLGEFGIGLNRRAAIGGNMLEDEKVFGTCHIAIGSNYDEDAPALIHLDGVINAPTIAVTTDEGEEVLVMEEGRHILLT